MSIDFEGNCRKRIMSLMFAINIVFREHPLAILRNYFWVGVISTGNIILMASVDILFNLRALNENVYSCWRMLTEFIQLVEISNCLIAY